MLQLIVISFLLILQSILCHLLPFLSPSMHLYGVGVQVCVFCVYKYIYFYVMYINVLKEMWDFVTCFVNDDCYIDDIIAF